MIDNTKSENSHRRKVKTTDESTDTPVGGQPYWRGTRSTSVGNPETDITRRMSPTKKQAIILDRPTGNLSYGDMFRKVKKMVLEKNLTYVITIRRAKSGNIVLKILKKIKWTR